MSGLNCMQSFLRNSLANHRAIDALNALVERAFIKRQNLYCCFIDFKKAFDSVRHQLLWYKQSTIGVSTNFLRLLIDIYANTQSCIQLNGKYTVSSAVLVLDRGVHSAQFCLLCLPMTYWMKLEKYVELS